MSEYKRKYRQDFPRCSGCNCTVKNKCSHHSAIIEARDLDLSYGKYLNAKSCIADNRSHLSLEEVEISI